MLIANWVQGVVLKPVVLLLAGLLLSRLWTLRHVAVFRMVLLGTAVFAAGELTCARDVYVVKGMTFGGEAIHDVCMMLAFGLWCYGLVRHGWRRVGCLRHDCPARPGCVMEPIDCRAAMRCGRFPVLLLCGGSLLAGMTMLTTPIVHGTYLAAGLMGRVVGGYAYDRTSALCVLQQLVFPALAAAGFLAASGWVLVLRELGDTAWKLTSLGLGALSFAMFRIGLINGYHPNVVFTTVFEEVLEAFLMVVFLVWIWPLSDEARGARDALPRA
ncbi:MAG: hypothetical protein HY814_09280 [Candidatus Riflebacteria bacterium]|nr:hypothetical protein [Candidatus Riflebacteria bacterium]